MTLYIETKIFIVFVLLGMLFSLIFDVFRAIRRVKKPNKFSLYIQDILFFLIIGIILIIILIYYMDSGIRLYNIFSIAIGVIIYVSIFGNSIRNIFCKLILINNKIVKFILITFDVYKIPLKKALKKLKKIVKNCCKKKLYMINFKYAKMKNCLFNKKIKTKED